MSSRFALHYNQEHPQAKCYGMLNQAFNYGNLLVAQSETIRTTQTMRMEVRNRGSSQKSKASMSIKHTKTSKTEKSDDDDKSKGNNNILISINSKRIKTQ